jgi:hemin uptake protein HemP
MSARSPDPDAARQPATCQSGAPETISSRKLFGNHRTLVIDHEGEQYTLRITSNRKLILTK